MSPRAGLPCDGNCGIDLEADDRDGYWTVLTPYVDELNFCSPACMSSWLAEVSHA